MPKGYIVSGYETWAAISRDTLARLGAPPDTLLEAPGVKTYRQRTLESARAVRDRLRELGIRPQGINVISEGPHARRTWATYRRVFRGDAVPVGVINVPPQDYDPERWWASSDGVKNTIAEGLGWLYEALFSSGG
jgi:hypothetical protein